MPVDGDTSAAVVHAVGAGALRDAFQLGGLFAVGGHDELAQPLVRHGAFAAVRVQQMLAAHAQAGLEAAGGVIDAGVDDFGIARAGPGADGFRGFGHQHFAAGLGQRAGNRQADHPCADDDAIDVHAHGAFLSDREPAGVRSKPPAWKTSGGSLLWPQR
ncbi:hypothetical protein G6F24_015949 [Rhizopus arrhizus]|nr:hypothetical protein G6F24_015949 [Rhizopus arrhizus]